MKTIMDYWINSSYRKWRFKKFKRLQTYMNRILNKLKNKTVGFGDYNCARNSTIKGRRGPIKYTKNFLRRNNVNLIEVDEYKTSQLCHNCLAKLGNYYPKTKTIVQFDMNYKDQWDDVTVQNNGTEYNVQFKRVDKIPFAKLKCCPNLEDCNNASKIQIVNRDVNAAYNILNKLRRMIDQEEELEAFKR